MRRVASFLLFALAFNADGSGADSAAESAAGSAAENAAESAVLDLTNVTLPLAIKEYRQLLIEFYAPWCGHCKSLEPEYAKAADLLRAEGSPIRLAKIDASLHTAVGAEYNVQGFPTIYFYAHGLEPASYNGARKAEAIVAWLKKKTGPAAALIQNQADLDRLKEENKVAVIGFFKNAGSAEATAFLETAAQFDKLIFGTTSSEDVFKANGINGENAVAVFRHFDERRVDFAGPFVAETLSAFVKDYSLPLVIEFSRENAEEVFGSEIKSHLLVFASKATPSYDAAVDNARKVAVLYRGKMLFAAVDLGAASEDSKNLMTFFALSDAQLPTYRIVHLGKDETTRFKPETDDLSSEAIGSFVARFFADEVQPYWKSEDLPADWDAGPVKVLVGTNYKSVVSDSGKKVLVEYYAPWCGHCKSLAPVWDQLGEKYRHSDDLIIAKIDSTANEIKGQQIYGFPTIKLFLPGQAKEIDYVGPRTLEGLSKFVDSDGKEGNEAAIEKQPEAEEAAESSQPDHWHTEL